MINLYTGLPGHGKTLLAVTELAKLLKHWDTDKGAAERREIWVWGIKGLQIPHKTIEAWPDSGKRGDPIPLDSRGRPTCTLAFDWGDIPDGSLVIVDEAQYCFPMRGPSQKAPPHVSFLNTHRHAGLDVWLITQHPRNIDNVTRRLVDKHQHIRRTFGWARAVTYQWDYCDDTLNGLKKAVMGSFGYPKATYALYHSAEIHTKNSFKKPWWIWLPLVVIPAAAWAIPAAWDGMSKVIGGVSLTPEHPKAPKAPPKPVAAPLAAPLQAPAPARAQPLTEAPTAPQAAASAPKFAGCIAGPKRCTCYDTAGARVDVEPDMCTTHTGADLPTKTADIAPASLDRFTPVAPRYDPRHNALVAWAEKQADIRRAAR